MDEYAFFFDHEQVIQETVREEKAPKQVRRLRMAWVNPYIPIVAHRLFTRPELAPIQANAPP